MPLSHLQQIQNAFSLEQVQNYTYDLSHIERTSSHKDFAVSSQYCADMLKEAGFQNVQRITHKADGVTSALDCIMPQAWDLMGRSTLEVVEGDVPQYSRMLADTALNPIHALVWSAPTPKGGVTCEIVDYDSMDPNKPDVKGKWVLFTHAHGSGLNGVIYRTLAEAGALGMAVADMATLETAPDNIFWTNGQGYCGWYHTKDDYRLPVFAISPRRAKMLAAALKCGKITVHAEMNTRIHDGEIYTVTGIIPGESEEEYALVAHLYEPFASDDAQGFAIGCEFGRQMVARGIKPKKTLRVIYSMEYYGLSAYLAVPEHRKNIVAGFNMDSFVSTCNSVSAFRLSPVTNALFGDWHFMDYFKKYLPQLEWQYEWGNLSDDTFCGDPDFNIPMNWIHTPCGIYHHNASQYFNPDWPKAAQMLPVFYEALEDLLNAKIKDYSKRAANEFKHKAAAIIRDTDLSRYEKEIRVQVEYERQLGRLASAESFGGPQMNADALNAEYADAKATLNSLLKQDLSAAEYKAINITVTDKIPGCPHSFARIPFKERKPQHHIPMLLWALFDGKRNLLECIKIMDADSTTPKKFEDNPSEAGAKPQIRASNATILAYIESLKYLEKYGYCKLQFNETTPQEFAKAIKQLGIKKGMKVVVHSTFSSLGHVEGGPDAICRVLQDAVGSEGTLMMPAFTFSIYEGKKFGAPYDVNNTPVDTGILSEVFRKLPGVLRSYDPCNSLSVWGKDALRYVEKHHLLPTMDSESPLGLLEKDDGWCLSISSDSSITFMHIVEVSNGAKCLGTRTEEYDGILPDGEKVKLRTWAWRKDTCEKCPARLTKELFMLMRAYGLREITLGNAHLAFFKLSTYRKAYETLLKGVCNQKSRAYPRTVAVTVPSDWDANRRTLSKDTTAYTGKYKLPN